MLYLLENMYFETKNGCLSKKPFQTGIFVSIKSTLDLYNVLKKEGVSYLLNSQINQDGLGKLFSYILNTLFLIFKLIFKCFNIYTMT